MSILPMSNNPLSPDYDHSLKGKKKSDESKSDKSKIHLPKKEKAGNTGVVKLPDETPSTSASTPKEKLRKKLSSFDQGTLNTSSNTQSKKSFIA